MKPLVFALALLATPSAAQDLTVLGLDGKHKGPVAEGWVQISGGELRVYPKQEDLGKLYDHSCISGMMAAHATKNVKKFNRRHVKVYGVLVEWSWFEEKIGRGWSFRGFKNYCYSEKVAIITRIIETPVAK